MSSQVAETPLSDAADVVTMSPREHGLHDESLDCGSVVAAEPEADETTALTHLFGHLLEGEVAPVVALILALI